MSFIRGWQQGSTSQRRSSMVVGCVRIGLMGQKWVQSATVELNQTGIVLMYRMGQPSSGTMVGLAYK